MAATWEAHDRAKPKLKQDPYNTRPLIPARVPVKVRKMSQVKGQIDSHLWIIPESLKPMPTMRPDATIIRQEFYDAIVAILAWIRTHHERADNSVGYEAVEDTCVAKDASGESNEELSGDAAQQTSLMDVDKPMSDVDLEDSGASDASLEHDPPIRLLPSKPPLSEHQQFPNPFGTVEAPFKVIGLHNLIVTGRPGIGKTSFLYVVFNLRAALNLPTLFMNRLGQAMLWKDDRLWRIDDPLSYDDLIWYLKDDPATWCLIDSNADLNDVPEAIWRLGLFVLQASSSRSERMQWKSKCFGVHYFVMREWSANELIAGLKWQAMAVSLSEPKDIYRFFDRFGGSARDTYNYAQHYGTFQEDIVASLSALKEEDIRTLLVAEPVTIKLPPAVRHQLLSVFPLTDDDRRLFAIKPPSESLMVDILKKLDQDIHLARRQMYRIYLGIKTTGCRALAAGLLDVHFHDWIVMGGRWALTPMVKGKTSRQRQMSVSWRSDLQGQRKFLISNKTIQVVDATPSATSTSPFEHIPTRSIRQQELELMTKNGKAIDPGVYYRATDNFPTFDAFYVVGQGEALVFQASLTEHGHGTTKAGITLLNSTGIDKLTYIYVTPSTTQNPRVAMPVSADYFDSVYCMALDYPENA